MSGDFTASFRDLDYGEFYTIRFEWVPAPAWRFLWWRSSEGYYRLWVVTMPETNLPCGVVAHLHAGNEICVIEKAKPKDAERARAIALHWIRGFSIYCRTGSFPNGAAKVAVN